MLRCLVVLLTFFTLSAASAAQEDESRIAPRPLQLAFGAIANGRWQNAARIAERDGPAAVALVEWIRLREGRGTPEEVLAFLEAHPDWPGLDYLRKRNEEVVSHADFDTVLAFYEDYRPQTGGGVLNYARALTARGQQGEAEASVVMAWHTMDLSTAEHDAFLEAYDELLKPHHEARLQMALWRGLRDVKQMLPLVDKKTRALAEARQKIESGTTLKTSDLPEGGAKDAGIAYERFNQYIKAGKSDDAIKLMLEQSRMENGLGEPDRWGGWRRYLAREKMREGDIATAYQLAAIHQLVDGSNYADLEWLSGYLALTYLDAPDLALDHFQRFRAAVETPISLGRAGYWIGRAQDALGDPEAAQLAYAFGGEYQTSFYGLLAAEKGGVPPDPALAGAAPDDTWRDADFAQSTLFKAGILLLRTDRLSLAEQFFVALTDTLEVDEINRLGHALDMMGEPHLEVMVGKAAAERGLVVPGPYYALHPMRDMDLPVPAELALAIARRESEFDHRVKSGAGAQGLMQLMPGTASDMARALGMSHSGARVITDWEYNAKLGSAYLAELVNRFDGNVVMVAAGYNAGPGRPLRWMKEYGDPRLGEVDIVDWIEHIPFRETQNYVMRVAESLPIYRARLGKDPLPVPFSEELSGQTLRKLALD
ncbi:lytic transglycosylase domain-containing protein [Roseovarius sp.]|uniref:lytic transglycosylase domain-containing protein n=1 Tax=Roseovarius sp. TaxID=1486281 RepID=UPI003BABBED8